MLGRLLRTNRRKRRVAWQMKPGTVSTVPFAVALVSSVRSRPANRVHPMVGVHLSVNGVLISPMHITVQSLHHGYSDGGYSLKTYPEIFTAAEAIRKGGLIRAGYLHTALATKLERTSFLSVIYPSMSQSELDKLSEQMVAAFARGQVIQEALCQIGYCREIPKGVRQ